MIYLLARLLQICHIYPPTSPMLVYYPFFMIVLVSIFKLIMAIILHYMNPVLLLRRNSKLYTAILNHNGSWMLILRSHIECNTMCSTSNRLAGRFSVKCRCTCITVFCFVRYSSMGIACKIVLVSGILAMGM